MILPLFFATLPRSGASPRSWRLATSWRLASWRFATLPVLPHPLVPDLLEETLQCCRLDRLLGWSLKGVVARRQIIGMEDPGDLTCLQEGRKLALEIARHRCLQTKISRPLQSKSISCRSKLLTTIQIQDFSEIVVSERIIIYNGFLKKG